MVSDLKYTLKRLQDDNLDSKGNFYECVLTEAIQNMSTDKLKQLGIDILNGTMMCISIFHVRQLWQQHKSKMFEAMETLEKLVKQVVEDHKNGILVKIMPDALVCFFPDKQINHESILTCLCSAYSLRKHLSTYPIILEQETMKIKINISYGPVYRRSLRIQRKFLYDYHGATVEDVMYEGRKAVIETNEVVTICNNDIMKLIDMRSMQQKLHLLQDNLDLLLNDGLMSMRAAKVKKKGMVDVDRTSSIY